MKEYKMAWKEKIENEVGNKTFATEEVLVISFEDAKEIAISNLEDFKSSLRKEIEEELNGYMHKRDGWKEHTRDWEAYDLTVRTLKKVLTLLDTCVPTVKEE